MAIQFLVIILVLGLISSYIISKNITTKTIENAKQSSKSIDLGINNCIDDISNISSELRYNYCIYNQELRSDTESLIAKIGSSESAIRGIWVNYENTNIRYIKPSYRILNELENDLKILRKDERIKSSNGIWYTTASGNTVKNIYYSYPLFHPYNFRYIGNLVICVDENFFKETCNKFLSEISHILLLNENNQIIYQSENSDFEVIESLKNYIDNELVIVNNRKHRVMLMAETIEVTNWKIVTYYNFSDIYNDVYQIRVKIIILCLLSIIIIFICNKYIDTELIRPAYLLVDAMSKTDHDGIASNISHIPQNEFKFVFETFNKTNERIRMLLDQNYKEKLTRQSAEIKALQAQINPHFLFNTLQSINWIAQMNNMKQISNMVTALSNILEASIGRNDMLIKLSEEIQYVDSFMYINKIRFEDQISFEKKIVPEADHILVPRLIIQPVVENSIKHGRKGRNVLHIRLDISRNQDLLEISVVDDGVGIPPEKVTAMNRSFSSTGVEYFNAKTFTKNGIGLENVNQRIKLIYGKQYGLYVESVENVYTKFTMRLSTIVKKIYKTEECEHV